MARRLTAEKAQELAEIQKKLDYSVMQLSREARFKHRQSSMDDRFFRGYDALVKAREELVAWREG